MTRRVYRTIAALTDFNEIADYLAGHSLETALGFIDDVEAACNQLL